MIVIFACSGAVDAANIGECAVDLPVFDMMIVKVRQVWSGANCPLRKTVLDKTDANAEPFESSQKMTSTVPYKS